MCACSEQIMADHSLTGKCGVPGYKKVMRWLRAWFIRSWLLFWPVWIWFSLGWVRAPGLLPIPDTFLLCSFRQHWGKCGKRWSSCGTRDGAAPEGVLLPGGSAAPSEFDAALRSSSSLLSSLPAKVPQEDVYSCSGVFRCSGLTGHHYLAGEQVRPPELSACVRTLERTQLASSEDVKNSCPTLISCRFPCCINTNC